MKQSNTVISVTITAAVLVAALGIGLFIREIRLGPHGSGSGQRVSQNAKDSVGTPLFGRDSRMASDHLSDEEITELREQQQEIIEKMANLSEEEREKFRVQMRERFRARRPRNRPGFRGLSPNEMNQLTERWRSSREGLAGVPAKQTEPNDQPQQTETQQESESE